MFLLQSNTNTGDKEAVEPVLAEFDELSKRIAPRFARLEAKLAALAYIKGLISPVERKNSWQLAEAIGDRDPYRFQHLLNRASWNADAVRDDLRDYVVEHLRDDNAVLIVDETGFLKKGNQSVGVQRQYSGTAGRTENCQIGVFLVYASCNGHTFIDRELYLPKSWASDRERSERAGVPENVEFATKLSLARKMLGRAVDAGVPARWVCADALYGTDHRLRQFIEARGLNYVLAVSYDQAIWVGKSQHRVDAIIRRIEESAWQTLSAGNGSKGERLYQWALATFEHPKKPQLQRFVLARRQLKNPAEITYYLASAPVGTGLQEIVKVAGVRWTIESCFQSAKGEVGLDQYEVRSWQSWYRHITLSLLAHAFLTVLKASVIEVKKGELPPQSSLFEFKKKRGLYYL